ncbi:MAG: hypothetical protein KatS3mg039_0799 [Candidatus Kapaibacterium sp.]|nr:MAG: hypothetical protein KatS3mg039_0799 [Candidatus Kapabacteria bacterium]
MKWIILLCSGAMLIVQALAQEHDSVIHFFSLPLDTSIAAPAPAMEQRDSSGLIIIDVAYGKGELSAPNRRHYVRFILSRASMEEYVYTEYAGTKVFAFIPDSTNVFPGFKYALKGMRVGGRRRAIIPPELAYGTRGRHSYGIGPNETLILDLELLKLDP